MALVGRQPRTALVVDDEPAVLDLVEEILIDAGFAISRFPRGRPALEAITQRRFDLLIIDVNLPDLSGMAICDAARARYGEDAAILVITADSRKDRVITALNLGADDFVPKPFHVDELLARIAAKLRRTQGNEA